MRVSIKFIRVILLVSLVFPLQGLIVRHDVPDSKLLDLAKLYPQIVHFYNGEGTLVAPQWVLTAAHVGELYKRETDPKKLTVACNGQNYQIERVVNHPHYVGEDGKAIENDVALVKLSKAVKNVEPARLFSGRNEKGKTITIVGSGYTGTGITGPQKEKWDHKTRAATNKVDDVEGNFIFFKFDAPGSKEATEFEGISGPGDSGGPAFIKLRNETFIIGISSHQKAYIEIDDNGKETGGEGKYTAVEFYSRVSDYEQWINQTMKLLSEK